jgi:hypothetical protein
MKLLSQGNSNAKTKKNYRPTKILYLHPSVVDGKDMCPYASDGCRASCLNTAGRGVFKTVQAARLRRTQHYVSNRLTFYEQLQKEITAFAKYHKKEVVIRLNGTSDQPFVETLIVAQMREIPSNVIFYDYTKNHKKAGTRILPSGHKYVVTFSYSEKDGSETQAKNVLDNGGTVALVFDQLPETWWGYPVVDGDSRDDLMVDIMPNIGGTILGLKAKGKARYENTGFVIKTK